MNKKIYSRILFGILAAVLLPVTHSAFAGNDTKKGSAGAVELLINPWAASTGLAGANTASVRGIESSNLNIAGLAWLAKEGNPGGEVSVCGTRYLSGSNISMFALGYGQKIGETGAMGINVVALNLGDFLETTFSQPEGTGNSFTPNYFNIGAGYSKVFSSSVSAGIMVRLINHTLPRASATDFGIDGGVQYSKNGFRFGVAMRNWGPKTFYSGEGMIVKGTINNDQNRYGLSLSNNSAQFEMPSQFNVGAGYDFTLAAEHRLSPSANFTSNSFTQDQIQVGAEYAFQEKFMFRAGYIIQNNMFSESQATDVALGPCAGVGFYLPFSQVNSRDDDGKVSLPGLSNTVLGFNYSYRATRYFDGHHSIGVSLGF
ncbi:MAG: PorV/PorQ family protein [Bacteroidota bacterium]